LSAALGDCFVSSARSPVRPCAPSSSGDGHSSPAWRYARFRDGFLVHAAPRLRSFNRQLADAPRDNASAGRRRVPVERRRRTAECHPSARAPPLGPGGAAEMQRPAGATFCAPAIRAAKMETLNHHICFTHTPVYCSHRAAPSGPPVPSQPSFPRFASSLLLPVPAQCSAR
jgi:hypothetical protein